MPKEKILVIDDEEDILELVRYNLEKDGYRVTCVYSAEEASEKLKEETPQLMLLDLMLPGISGLDFCKMLRSDPVYSNIPILMITAKEKDADIVTGLELGADDYLTKPFSPRILVARIRAILRRNKQDEASETSVIKLHDIVVNPVRHEVLLKGESLLLGPTEFAILHFMARRPGWVFSREQIINAVKGEDYPATGRSVDVQIVGLRKKLGTSGDMIETIRGIGYRIKE